MEDKRKYFLITEAVIYVLFIVYDLRGNDSVFIKYLGILLCMMYCFSKKDLLFSMALSFTAISDLFLLVLDRHYEIGVSTFVIVQLLYWFYFHRNGKAYTYGRLLVFLGILIGLYVTKNVTVLNVLVSFYFINLCFNFVSSLSDRKYVLLSFGFFLFICCDICVGLHNVLPYGKMYSVVSFLMWVFYLPSQVLISLYCEENMHGN